MPSRRELANAIRALAMDAVQKAKSGHPGMPMGMADIAEVLWNDYLKHDPANPEVAGPGSLRAVQRPRLHAAVRAAASQRLRLCPMDELKRFRQLHSKTPGHPEYGIDAGGRDHHRSPGPGARQRRGHGHRRESRWRRASTGLASKWWTTTLMCSWATAASWKASPTKPVRLPARLGLGKLIAFYDDNGISIDGEVHGWFTDDTPKRFEAYGWHVVPASGRP